MSKRAGEFITLDELLAEVGVDAARWFFASRGADDRDRLRHRAGQEAVGREPGLLRPVRPRPDRVDPAQGGRGRARRRRPASTGSLAGAPEARARPGDRRASRRSSRTRPRSEETQGVTAYATELATAVPRLLPRRPGRRPRGAGALGGAPGARVGGPDHPRQRPRPARDLRARLDVAARRSAGRRLSRRGRGRRRAAFERRVVRADHDPALRAAGARQQLRPAPASASTSGVAAASNSAASAARVPVGPEDDAPTAPFGPSRSGDPIAAPAGAPQRSAAPARDRRRCRAARPASWNSPNVSSSADRPAGAEPRREIRRQGRPRSAARGSRTSRGGGSARSSRAARRTRR